MPHDFGTGAPVAVMGMEAAAYYPQLSPSCVRAAGIDATLTTSFDATVPLP